MFSEVRRRGQDAYGCVCVYSRVENKAASCSGVYYTCICPHMYTVRHSPVARINSTFTVASLPFLVVPCWERDTAIMSHDLDMMSKTCHSLTGSDNMTDSSKGPYSVSPGVMHLHTKLNNYDWMTVTSIAKYTIFITLLNTFTYEVKNVL